MLMFLTVVVSMEGSDATLVSVSPRLRDVTGESTSYQQNFEFFWRNIDHWLSGTGTVRRERMRRIVLRARQLAYPCVRDWSQTLESVTVLQTRGSVTTTCVWVTRSGATVCQSAEICLMSPQPAPRVWGGYHWPTRPSSVTTWRTVQTSLMKHQHLVAALNKAGDVTQVTDQSEASTYKSDQSEASSN